MSVRATIALTMIAALSAAAAPDGTAQAWQSEIVYYGDDGLLVYESDAEGNRIPDFSGAGFGGGGVDIPTAPVLKSIAPIEGDNTAHIQAALDEVGAAPLGSGGIRGAVLLEPGEYIIEGTIHVNHAGVVLRGSGDGPDPEHDTILLGVGDEPHQRTIIVAGSGRQTTWRGAVPGTRTDVISDFVPVGSRTFEVEDASRLRVGDNIIIFHPSTDAWLQAIDYGGTASDLPGATSSDVPWEPGDEQIIYNRYVTDIRGSEITIDAPIFNHLDRSLSQSYIYRHDRDDILTNIGIENLRVDIVTTGGEDEDHAWTAVELMGIEDAWVRGCTMLHFGLSGVRTATASRVTVEDVRALDPVARVAGARMYNFNVYRASNQILFKNTHASNGRHHYVSNGTSSASGIVFLHTSSEGAYAGSEGHRRWSQGMLWDNHVELDGPRNGVNPRLLGLYNRGHYGTSHGWGVVHAVAWNCDVAAGDLIVQKPPTGQNYAIGCRGGRITGDRPPASFHEPEGYIDGSGREGLEPASLYEAQLADRLTREAVATERPAPKPAAARLGTNYPQPFTGSTHVPFDLAQRERVRIGVFDLAGRRVAVLADRIFGAGRHEVRWKPGSLAAGVYVCRFQAGEFVSHRKLVHLR